MKIFIGFIIIILTSINVRLNISIGYTDIILIIDYKFSLVPSTQTFTEQTVIQFSFCVRMIFEEETSVWQIAFHFPFNLLPLTIVSV
jgi:hypothetical protein